MILWEFLLLAHFTTANSAESCMETSSGAESELGEINPATRRRRCTASLSSPRPANTALQVLPLHPGRSRGCQEQGASGIGSPGLERGAGEVW